MAFRDIRSEALALPREDRAALVEALLVSLDDLSVDSEIEAAWAAEAARRFRELDADPSMGIPAEEVFLSARARLR